MSFPLVVPHEEMRALCVVGAARRAPPRFDERRPQQRLPVACFVGIVGKREPGDAGGRNQHGLFKRRQRLRIERGLKREGA